MRGRLLLAALLTLAAAPPSAPTGPVFARRHMAATANPLASAASLSILREHGTAVDAAIAAQMVLAVVEPQASGIGGGAIMLSWDQATRSITSFDGLASAPASVPERLDLSSEAVDAIKRSGLSVGVPGVLRMLAMAHARTGRAGWPRLTRDAITLAERGFALPPYLYRVLTLFPGLAKVPAFAKIYFDEAGHPLAAGTLVHNRELAALLRVIAREGPEAFYQAPIADAVVKAVGAAAIPGRMTSSDLADYRAVERAPLCDSAFGHRICTAAPPSAGGVALLQQLRLLDRLGISRTSPGSVEAVHLFLEAGRLSLADRRAWVGDPDRVEVPTAGLLEQVYIDQRAALIDPVHAMPRVPAGLPSSRHAIAPEAEPLALPATSHLAVVDDAGNAVSMTTTVNLDFGAWLVADGMVLNDGLTNFAALTSQDGVRVANAIAPNKRPATTIAPTIVFDAEGKPQIVLGAGGGARIIDAVAETLVGMLAWHQDILAAISQPRYGAQTGREELEIGTPAALLADRLVMMGHTVDVDRMNAAVQGITITPTGLAGWGDRHRDGVAVGN